MRPTAFLSPLPLLQQQSSVSPFSHHSTVLSLINDRIVTALPTTTNTAFAEALTTTTTTTIANTNNDAWNILWSPETVVAPLNAASESWVRSLVWLDFKVAVAFFVVAPLILLAWAVVARIPPNNEPQKSVDSNVRVDVTSLVVSPPMAETILRYMTSYWQASSLLLLTLTLDIQEETVCVVVGLLAQLMIVVSLWWWEDLNAELLLDDSTSHSNNDTSITNVFLAWRNVATLAACTGVIIQVPFQTCIGASSLVESSWCAPWLEPPKFAAGLVGIEASPALELLTLGGCALYGIVLIYYVVVLLPSVGRSGRAARPEAMNVATPIGIWQRMGFLEDQDTKE